MPAPTPEFLPQSFAQNAGGSFRNTIPNTTATPGRASFNLGFPPLTMTPVVAGGVPPFGQDVNGILYMLSTHAFAQQAGQAPLWSADIAAAISGYAIGTVLGSTTPGTLWFNTTAANSTDPDAGGAGWVAMYSYGVTTVNVTGGSTTLTAAQAAKGVIVVTGALASNQAIILPNHVRFWLIVNNTSGAFTLTVRTALGTGVVVGQGGFAAPVEVWGDATNIYPTVAPLSIPTAEGPVPSTYPIRSNAGYLYATYFNMSGAADAFALTHIIYETGGDGFLRKMPQANFRAQLFASPVLTGVPEAPTAAPGTSTTQIATTAFVQGSVGGANFGGYVDSLAASPILPPGWTASRGLIGRYTIVHNLGLSNGTLLAFVTMPYNPSTNRRIRFDVAGTDGNQVSLQITDNAEGSFADAAFFFEAKRLA